MSTVISVENLGKKYTLRHQQRESYTALRDVLTNGIASIGQRILHPFRRPSTDQQAQEEFWALRDISFEVKQGDRIGIIGRNGAGKSTLLKILSRIIGLTDGHFILRCRVANLLEVGTGLHLGLTGREPIPTSRLFISALPRGNAVAPPQRSVPVVRRRFIAFSSHVVTLAQENTAT